MPQFNAPSTCEASDASDPLCLHEPVRRCRRGGGSCGLGTRRVPRGPNAQVQGRPLGMAEARSGEGVPCNAQLGWLLMLGGLFINGLCWLTFVCDSQGWREFHLLKSCLIACVFVVSVY